MSPKLYLCLIGIVLLFFVNVSSYAQSVTNEPYKIGLVGALSGPKAPYGLSQFRGAQLAISEINLSPKFQNRPMAIIPQNDQGEPGKVGPLVDSLLYKHRVIAIVGSTDSGCTHVISMMAVKTHTPHITCVATDPSLTRAGNPWTFRTLADDERQAEALIKLMVGKLGLRRIGLICAQSRYGRMGAKTFGRLAKKAGVQVFGPYILEQIVKGESSDSLPEAEKALQMNPDAIVAWTLAEDGVRIVSFLASKNFKGLIGGGDGLAAPGFYASKKPGVEGTIITCPYDQSSKTGLNQSFQKRYFEEFNQWPDSFAAHAYDTIYLIAKALNESDETRTGLRDAIAKIHYFEGVTGQIQLDRSGNDIRRVKLARCENGALKVIEGQ